jgi:hypothetical protein
LPSRNGQNAFKCSLACLNFESLPGTPLPRFGTAENSRQGFGSLSSTFSDYRNGLTCRSECRSIPLTIKWKS